MSILISNKKAYFSYEIIDKLITGIALSGGEVKSLKAGQGNIDEAFIANKDNNLAIINFYIPPFQKQLNHDSTRPRQLLANKREILTLLKQKETKGLTIIPLALHNIKGLIKLEIALARGKKMADKRNTIKTKDIERELGRTLKNRK